MSSPRIIVFIPAYRCAAQIVRVIDQFDASVVPWVDTVMVVDNRSPDSTLADAINRGAQKLAGVNFIAWKNDDNYGLGGSHKAALRYAVDKGFDYLIVLHGDDQADIRDLLPQLEKGRHLECDCLLGARFMLGSRLKGYSRFRTLGNRVYNGLFSVASGRRVYDLGSGLNMYRLPPLRDFYYKGYPDDLTFNYVMLLGSFVRRQRVAFFPISWREDDQVSNVKLFRQAFRVLGLLARFSLRRGAFLHQDMRTKPFDAYAGQIVERHEKRNA